MSKAAETIQFLAHFNSWRRGDETIEQPNPSEIGAAIDDAVNLLRRFDSLQADAARLREELQYGTATGEPCAELVKVQAENKRLRAALDSIAGNRGEASPVTLTEAQEEARAALAKEGTP